jgi:N6-adenosine-specific RNA methylase IME4
MKNIILAKKMLHDPSLTNMAISRATNVPESTIRSWRKRLDIITNGNWRSQEIFSDEVIHILTTEIGEDEEKYRKYRVLLADPPWEYGNKSTRNAASKQYQTQSVTDICDMPFSQMCMDDSYCFLWATVPLIREAFTVLEAWGFDYKSQFIWCKDGSPGMGNYWRISHELLLLGKRGNPPVPRPSTRAKSFLRTKRGRHSEKPKSVRAMIERMVDGPYMELYGREKVLGWTVYGMHNIEGNKD